MSKVVTDHPAITRSKRLTSKITDNYTITPRTQLTGNTAVRCFSNVMPEYRLE